MPIKIILANDNNTEVVFCTYRIKASQIEKLERFLLDQCEAEIII